MSAARSRTRIDVAALTVATIAVRIPAFVADRALTFDDAVYGASAMAMRDGGVPYRDVFSSQGPLFLPLVWLADLIGFRTLNAPRTVAIASGIAITLAVYAIGLRIADRGGALLAAGLTSATASLLWTTGPVASDGPALAFAAIVVACTLHWRDDLTTRRTIAIGLLVGAALSVKALVVGSVFPVAIVVLLARRWKLLAAIGSVALAFHVALMFLWGWHDVWYQSYGYHLEVAGERTPGENLAKVASTLGDRDLPVLVAVALAIAAVVVGRRAIEVAGDRVDIVLLSWVAGVLVVLLLEHPLWRPHISQLIPPLALLAARHRPPWPVLAVAGVLVAPYHLARADNILWPKGPDAVERAVRAELDALLVDEALVISDDPGVVWRAGRTTTPDLVDTSGLRIEAGDMTEASIAAAAREPGVCAVLIWSTSRWGSFDGLPRRLTELGYVLELDDGPGRQLYLVRGCLPG